MTGKNKNADTRMEQNNGQSFAKVEIHRGLCQQDS